MDNSLNRILQVLGVWAVPLGLIAAALPFFQAHWAIWVAATLWIVASLTLLVLLQTPAGRTKIQALLRDPTFRQAYRISVFPLFRKLWRHYGRALPGHTDNSPLRNIGAAFSWPLLDTALRIAVAYPYILFVGVWVVLGQDAQIGEVTILEGTGFWPIGGARLAMLVGFSIFALSLVGLRMARTTTHFVFQNGMVWSLPFAIAVFVAGAATNAVTAVGAVVAASSITITSVPKTSGGIVVTVSVAIAVLIAVTIAVAGTAAGTFAGVFILGAILASSLAVTVGRLYVIGKFGAANVLLLLCVSLSVTTALLWSDWTVTNAGHRAIFLFLGVLPLVNALFDIVSYAVTLGLIRMGLRSQKWFGALFAGLLDLVCAIALFLALGVALTASVAAMNQAAGVDFVDLTALFDAVSDDPASHLWLIAMLFSTILPTGLHLMLSLLGLQSLVPAPLRHLSARLVERSGTDNREDAGPAIVAPVLAGLCLCIPLYLGCGLIYAIWVLAHPALDTFGGWYFDQLHRIADHWIDVI